MNRLFFFLLIILLSYARQSVPSKEDQIAAAVLATSPELRDGATVLGYSSFGSLITLRKGTNQIICLADDPNQSGFSVAAYHKDLDPFMARGRELKMQGKSFKDRFTIRENDVKSGKFVMPKKATTLYILSGKNAKYDKKSNTVTGAKYRYVIYIPYATAESTGLPIGPQVKGGPWIMDPGTYRAHIMISPTNQQ